MRVEGDIRAVISVLRRKKQLFEAGDQSHEKLVTALCAHSGNMRGTYGGGQVAAIEMLGYTSSFDHFAGCSTGSPAVAYLSAGQAELGRTIYWEECTQGFLSLRRFIKRGPLASTHNYLMPIFRGEVGDKGLNQERIRESRSQLHIAVTDSQTGEGLFVDAKKTRPDVVQAIGASISMPGLSEGPLMIDGRSCFDGAGGLPFLGYALHARTKTDVMLLLMNAARLKRDSLRNRILSPVVLRNLSEGARTAFLTAHERFNDEYMQWRRNPPCQWAAIWTDDEVGSFEQKPEPLKAASDRAKRHLADLLSRA